MAGTSYKTDISGVIEEIGRQAEGLVVPSLNGLRAVLLERTSALRLEDSQLAQEQEAVSCAGFAAAVRLMSPGVVMLPTDHAAPAHYLALPKQRNGGSHER